MQRLTICGAIVEDRVFLSKQSVSRTVDIAGRAELGTARCGAVQQHTRGKTNVARVCIRALSRTSQTAPRMREEWRARQGSTVERKEGREEEGEGGEAKISFEGLQRHLGLRASGCPAHILRTVATRNPLIAIAQALIARASTESNVGRWSLA